MVRGCTVIVWAALAAGLGWSTARADEMQLASSPATRCLDRGPADKPLVYPERYLERKDGGTVNVELTFTAPDKAPRAKIEDEESTFDGLIDAVRDHVRRFRVPCMDAAGPPVVIHQSYVFVPNDGRKVVSTTPTEAADEGRRQKLACIQHVRGEKRPDYPRAAQVEQEQGNVLVRLRFVRPDQPPEVQVLASARSRPLRLEVLRHVAGLRMPCLDGEPIETMQNYHFVIDGGSRELLPDLGLARLIAGAQSVERGVYFDLKTMGCPFDVRFTYNRPYGPNKVQELETSNPARRAFLDWLGSVTLKLPEETATQVLGQTITVGVPCTTIDL